jgi:hypothetical protein
VSPDKQGQISMRALSAFDSMKARRGVFSTAIHPEILQL